MRRRIKTPKAPIAYELAPEVEELAKDLVRRYHQHLVNAGLVYLWRTGNWKKGGKRVLGTAEKVGGKTSFWLRQAMHWDRDLVYAVTISKQAWPELSHDQRLALIDHELCHFVPNDAGKIEIVEHDVTEFRAVLERHGFWEDELRRFCEAAVKAQQALAFVAEQEPAPAD